MTANRKTSSRQGTGLALKSIRVPEPLIGTVKILVDRFFLDCQAREILKSREQLERALEAELNSEFDLELLKLQGIQANLGLSEISTEGLDKLAQLPLNKTFSSVAKSEE
jgi:hypothetical protein